MYIADVDQLHAEESELRVQNGHHEETALANQPFTQIGINVTNEAGQVRVLDGRFVVLCASIVSYVISATSFL